MCNAILPPSGGSGPSAMAALPGGAARNALARSSLSRPATR